MGIKKVILLGELHTDLEKHNRYACAIARFDPDMLSLEAQSEEELSQFVDTSKVYVSQAEAQRQAIGMMLRMSNRRALESVVGGYGLFAHGWREKTNGSIIFADAMQDITINALNEMDKGGDHPFSPSEVAIIEGVGHKEFERALKYGAVDEAFYGAIFNIARDGTRIQLRKLQEHTDCLYSDELDKITLEDAESVGFGIRDQATAKKILNNGAGVVVHIGGVHHAFGPHRNLYDLLSEKVEVDRYRLLDFSHDSPGDVCVYKERITELTEVIKKKHMGLRYKFNHVNHST